MMGRLAEFKLEERILYSTINSIEPTDEDIQNYAVEFLDIIQKLDYKVVLIVDTTTAKVLKAEHRVGIGNILKHNRNIIVKKVNALVYVVSHPILQFVLNGIFLVSKPPVNYYVTSRLDKAQHWAKSNYGALESK